MPRIGVIALKTADYSDTIREAGGEPVSSSLPRECSKGGVTLHREWIADRTQISCFSKDLDALLLSATEPAELAGLLIAALRLDLPVVVVPVRAPFSIALAALGFTPIAEDAAGIAVELAGSGKPRSRELVEGFSLANALRAGLASGAGPELLVHLAAIAREAGVIGFPQMIRVLAPESPKVVDLGSSWFDTHGAAGLLSYLGDALHDTRTVTGRLKEALQPTPPAPALEDQEAAGSRLVFVRGRASGTEVVCRTDSGAPEVSGDCSFFGSEEAAVWAVKGGKIERSELLVVAGCGPGGGPGLVRLDRLAGALGDAGLDVPVLTDGLSPEDAPGAWASLMTPEAAASGVIGRLRDGDFLRIDLEKGLIRTGAAAEEIRDREPFATPVLSNYGYAARYARSALPALEGAGFR